VRLKRFSRISIVTRIVLAGCVSLVLFAIAMLVFIKFDLQQSIYTETDTRVQIAQNTMRELIRTKGWPRSSTGNYDSAAGWQTAITRSWTIFTP